MGWPMRAVRCSFGHEQSRGSTRSTLPLAVFKPRRRLGAIVRWLRHPRQQGLQALRTVTHTSPSFAVTPVGGYGIGIRLTSLVFGSIRHSARSRGVVAQM
jgi:hypothetical protein